MLIARSIRSSPRAPRSSHHGQKALAQYIKSLPNFVWDGLALHCPFICRGSVVLSVVLPGTQGYYGVGLRELFFFIFGSSPFITSLLHVA